MHWYEVDGIREVASNVLVLYLLLSKETSERYNFSIDSLTLHKGAWSLFCHVYSLLWSLCRVVAER